ncbi:MAG: hypothetical protein COB42_04550 [Sulfurimonas sp.]|nr:MAG: hypothetical protein COB42_04550 [Sulfurimonas sp.]
MVRRFAFTMIELIFAIVIISISVLSLPMMNQVISDNIEGSITQEAIFAASAELNQIISYHWDENSLQNGVSLSRVVWATANDCDPLTQLRPGHIREPLHRRCTDVATPTPANNLGSEGGDLDDLDDINQNPHAIFINIGNAGNRALEYKNAYMSTFNVSYATIDPAYVIPNDDTNNNIKRIRVTVSDAAGVVTELTTFSSNIGEIDYYKRTYP